MTLGTVNALVASHFYVVPAMLDRVSSEAVAPFLTQVEGLKRDLELDLRLAAIAPTMTRQAEMSSSEKRYLQQIEATAEEIVGKPGSTLALNVPRRAQITNEEDLGYFLSDDNGPLSRFYNPVFDEIWRRMHNPAPESVY
jgi:cellulose biosynthesis protein BcsQ